MLVLFTVILLLIGACVAALAAIVCDWLYCKFIDKREKKK